MTRAKRFLTSRLSKLRKPAKPEALLWERLDTCAIDFRAPMSELIDRYGAAPSIWADQLDVCILSDAKALIAGLAHPPAFQFSPSSDLSAPPRDLFCAVQTSHDHRINYAKAIAALRPHFGEGTVGTSANTASREWNFGHASLSCTVWPPENQRQGRNTRHELFPETITEAAIWILTAYRPALTQEELAECLSATALSLPSSPPSRVIAVGRLTYDWPSDAPALGTGLYLTNEDTKLIKKTTPDLIDILPRTWMSSVGLDRITGGRGGQEAIVTIRYLKPGQDQARHQTMTLCDQYGSPNGLDHFAEDLATRLDLPLDIYEGPRD